MMGHWDNSNNSVWDFVKEVDVLWLDVAHIIFDKSQMYNIKFEFIDDLFTGLLG